MPLLALILVFVIVPIAELYVILKVGDAIGIGWTILLLVADSLLGSALLRSQGRTVWRRFNAALAEGRMPHREVMDGVLVIFGGAFLITPGFITDVFGLLLLLPPTRAIIRRLFVARLGRRVAVGVTGSRRRPRDFDVLALPTAMFGGPQGLPAGTALLNSACVLGIAILARRRGGWLLASAAIAVTTLLCGTMGSQLLFDPWSPNNLLLPGLARSMGEGWETARRRDRDNDWVVVRLGMPGLIRLIDVDTTHFKGNAPDRCSIQAGCVTGGTDQSTVAHSMFWRHLLPEQKLRPDTAHHFEQEVASLGVVTHVRLNVIPDGGINRVRMFGISSSI